MRFKLELQPLQPLLELAMRNNQGYASSYNATIRLGECPPAQVRVDTMRLVQVLSNLLSNAAKFSPPGERIDLFAETVTTDRVRISVRDHGPGVAASFRERIFSRFAQADSSDTRPQGGTGLGLAISKELTEHMGGQIGFVSPPGTGACFWVELPCQSERDLPT